MYATFYLEIAGFSGKLTVGKKLIGKDDAITFSPSKG